MSKMTKQNALVLFERWSGEGRLRTYDHKDQSEKLMVFHFNSPRDYANACTSDGWFCEEGRADGTEWVYGSGVDRATTTDLARRGKVSEQLAKLIADYTEQARKLSLPKIKSKKQSIKPRKHLTMTGGSRFRADCYAMGDPNGWVRLKQRGKRRVVRLGLRFSVSCGNSEEAFAKTCAMTVAVCRLLESLGYATEIVGLGMAYGNFWAGPTVTLKRAGERFDVQKIACMAYPAFLRDFGFVVSDALGYGAQTGTGAYGYGRAITYPDHVLESLGLTAVAEVSWTRGAKEQTEAITSIIDKVAGC